LPEGTYRATVDVSSTNGGTATLGVTFTVAPPPPRLVVKPDMLVFSNVGPVRTQAVRASNENGSFADLGRLMLDSAATTPWLRNVSIDGDIIAVTPDVDTLRATASGTVIINSARGGSATIRVRVDVTIVERPSRRGTETPEERHDQD
jgi:hypothetical protein